LITTENSETNEIWPATATRSQIQSLRYICSLRYRRKVHTDTDTFMDTKEEGVDA